jgi:PTH1 family peptidyl-tRNA hydrolase
MKLIVGLGNPGPRYSGTRHNVGWRVVEDLAAALGAGSWREKFDAFVAEAPCGGQKVALARPLTFMNLSGLAVRQAMDFWKLDLADLLVVLDDMALEAGRIRLRTEGSAGGHNGLASVIAHVGTDGFSRLRVGIGPAPRVDEHVDFVLSAFTKSERPAVDDAIDRAVAAARCWVTDGPEAAMNRFNRVARDEP